MKNPTDPSNMALAQLLADAATTNITCASSLTQHPLGSNFPGPVDQVAREKILTAFSNAGSNFSNGLTTILQFVWGRVAPDEECGFLSICTNEEKIRLLRTALAILKSNHEIQLLFTQVLDEYLHAERLRSRVIHRLYFYHSDYGLNEFQLNEVDELVFMMRKAFWNLDEAIGSQFTDFRRRTKHPLDSAKEYEKGLAAFAGYNKMLKDEAQREATKMTAKMELSKQG